MLAHGTPGRLGLRLVCALAWPQRRLIVTLDSRESGTHHAVGRIGNASLWKLDCGADGVLRGDAGRVGTVGRQDGLENTLWNMAYLLAGIVVGLTALAILGDGAAIAVGVLWCIGLYVWWRMAKRKRT